jgi:hypothetical protein
VTYLVDFHESKVPPDASATAEAKGGKASFHIFCVPLKPPFWSEFICVFPEDMFVTV